MSVISISDAIADEGTNLVFNVTLSEPSLADVQVTYRAVNEGSANVDRSDVNSSDPLGAFLLTIPAGETSATIVYRTDQFDRTDEPDENFAIELSDPVNATLSGGEPVLKATGVILDNDGGQDRALFVSDPVLLEGDSGTKQAEFQVRISEASTVPITLNYTTIDNTATAGEDYVAQSGQITFSPGQLVASVLVDVIGDTKDEISETFGLLVEPSVQVSESLRDAQGLATLIADDSPSTLPVLSISDAIANEGSNVVFSVMLSEPSLADISFSYRLVKDGFAELNSGDINSSNAPGTFTATIPAGQTNIILPYRTDQFDRFDEQDENFAIEISDPQNAVLAGGEQTLKATGVILDDDGGQDRSLFVSDPVIAEGDNGNKQAVFEVRLSEPSGTAITVNYQTRDGTAKAGLDYVAKSGSVTFAPGQTVATVAVDVRSDQLVEADEVFSLIFEPTLAIPGSLQDTTGIATLLDDDTESDFPVINITDVSTDEGTNTVFAVTLSKPSLADVSVTYRAVYDGSAQFEGSDFNTRNVTDEGVLLIPAGETSATITYNTSQFDRTDEPDENFALELSDPVNAVLAGGEPTLKATGITLDNDGGQDRALFVSDPVLLEGDDGRKKAVFEVTLSEPSENTITLTYSTADGTALAGEDYIATSGQLTFIPGQTIASVEVDVLGDSKIEDTEEFQLVFDSNIAIFDSIRDAAGTASIVADDTLSVLPVLSVSDAITDEGANMVFTARLSEPSLVDVTAQFRLVADGSAQLNSTDFSTRNVTNTNLLTIPAGQTTAVITYATDQFDRTDEHDENVALEITNPVNAVLAGGEATLKATGITLDNDGGQDRGLFVSDPTIQEGDSGTKQAVFELRLSEPSQNAITLSYNTADGTARAGEDYIAKSGTVTFKPGQTMASVSVTVLSDVRFENQQTFSLSVTPTIEIFNGSDDAAGIATILDDDGSIVGSNRGEPLIGTAGDDKIIGLAGDDRLMGNGGNDILNGGTGRDILNGGTGYDTVTYANAASAVAVNLTRAAGYSGESLGDVIGFVEGIIGSDFNDGLVGNAAANRIEGGNGADYIAGFAGNDVLIGGAGNDRLLGGSGNDIMSGGAGRDRFEGSTGIDLVSYADASSTVSINLLAGVGAFNDASGDTFSGIENVVGSNFADRIIGTAGSNVISGGGGNDQLIGFRGNDVLNGNGGNDILRSGDGADVLNGGSGFDWAWYASSPVGVTINLRADVGAGGFATGDRYTSIEYGFGSQHRDIIIGDTGNNYLVGFGGNDAINGDAGNDRIRGHTGDDTMIGGTGADSFDFNPGDGSDTITDFSDDEDTIDFRDMGFSTVGQALATASQRGADVVFDLAGNDELIVLNTTVAMFSDDILV